METLALYQSHVKLTKLICWLTSVQERKSKVIEAEN